MSHKFGFNKRHQKVKTVIKKKSYRVIKAHDFISLLSSKPFILDVRTKDELAMGYFSDSLRIPFTSLMSEVNKNKNLLPKDQQIFVICKDGIRSKIACQFLVQKQLYDVAAVEGGFQELLEKNSVELQYRIKNSNLYEQPPDNSQSAHQSIDLDMLQMVKENLLKQKILVIKDKKLQQQKMENILNSKPSMTDEIDSTKSPNQQVEFTFSNALDAEYLERQDEFHQKLKFFIDKMILEEVKKK